MLENIFGSTPETRILDFYFQYGPFDYPISQVSRILRLDRDIVRRAMKKLERYGLIRETRRVRRQVMYSISDNAFARTVEMVRNNLYEQLLVSEEVQEALQADE